MQGGFTVGACGLCKICCWLHRGVALRCAKVFGFCSSDKLRGRKCLPFSLTDVRAWQNSSSELSRFQFRLLQTFQQPGPSAQESRSSSSRAECSAQARATSRLAFDFYSRRSARAADGTRNGKVTWSVEQPARLCLCIRSRTTRHGLRPSRALFFQTFLLAKHCMHPETNSSRSRSPQAQWLLILQRSTPHVSKDTPRFPPPPAPKARGRLYRVKSWKTGFRGCVSCPMCYSCSL